MGQQQIILLLLVTIIVGLATILAINTMQNANAKSNREAIRQRMMEATTIAQAYLIKNSSIGGGGGSYENVTLENIDVDSSDANMAEFSISDAGVSSFTLTAVPASGGDKIVGVIYSDRIEFVDASEAQSED